MKNLAWLLPIGVIGLIIYGLTESPAVSTQPQTTTTQTTVTKPAVVQSSSLEEKSQCAKDGAAFVQNYEASNNQENGAGFRPVWYTPEYHYDSRLGTCIVYTGYADTLYQEDLADITDGNIVESLFIYNYVFDIYSNKTLLYSLIDREASGGSTKDTVVSNEFDEYRSLSMSDFGTQMQVLMNE